jgi:hypothetical protein
MKKSIKVWELFESTPLFFALHAALALLIFDFFVFTPDEIAYLETFSKLYDGASSNPTWGSGWFGTPPLFLQVVYFPSYLLTLVGLPNFLALRFASIVLITIGFSMCKSIMRQGSLGDSNSKLKKFAVLLFYIPSIFLWTTTGLRESFLLFGLILVFFAFNKLDYKPAFFGYLLAFIGSYVLISTKFYLWIVFACSVVVSVLVAVIILRNYKTSLNKIIASVIFPFFFFVLTVPAPVFDFLVETIRPGSVQSAGERVGSSLTKVKVEANDVSGSNSLENENDGTSKTETEQTGELVITGDYTLIAVQNYINDKPTAIMSKLIEFFGVGSVIESRYQEVIGKMSEKVSESKTKGAIKATDPSKLEPGKLSSPPSVMAAGLVFMAGQIPLLQSRSLFLDITAWESPIWWGCYMYIFIQLLMLTKRKTSINLELIFPLVTFVFFVGFNALVQVNAGTAFRHRSILLPSIIFLILGFHQKRSISTK